MIAGVNSGIDDTTDLVKAPALTLDQTSFVLSMSPYSTTSRDEQRQRDHQCFDLAELHRVARQQPNSSVLVTMSFVAGSAATVCADIVFTDPNARSDSIPLSFVLNVM